MADAHMVHLSSSDDAAGLSLIMRYASRTGSCGGNVSSSSGGVGCRMSGERQPPPGMPLEVLRLCASIACMWASSLIVRAKQEFEYLRCVAGLIDGDRTTWSSRSVSQGWKALSQSLAALMLEIQEWERCVSAAGWADLRWARAHIRSIKVSIRAFWRSSQPCISAAPTSLCPSGIALRAWTLMRLLGTNPEETSAKLLLDMVRWGNVVITRRAWEAPDRVRLKIDLMSAQVEFPSADHRILHPDYPPGVPLWLPMRTHEVYLQVLLIIIHTGEATFQPAFQAEGWPYAIANPPTTVLTQWADNWETFVTQMWESEQETSWRRWHCGKYRNLAKLCRSTKWQDRSRQAMTRFLLCSGGTTSIYPPTLGW